MRWTTLLGAALSWPLVASAQGQNAEFLFDKGVDALEAGRFPEACPLLAESQRLDPRPGTLFTLADCESKWGKLARSVEHYEEYLQQAEALPAAQKPKHTARIQKASEALSRLNARVGRVTLGGAPAGSEVKLDDRALAPESLAKAQILEPGAHQATLRLGGLDTITRFSVQAGESRQVTLEQPAPPASAAAPPPSAPPPARPPPPPRSPTAFYVAAGLGGVGLVAGLAGGLLALSKKTTVDRECAGLACTQAGLDALDSGRTFATLSTVGFVVGLVGVGAAAGLWGSGLSSPTAQTSLRIAPLIGSQELGLLAGGHW